MTEKWLNKKADGPLTLDPQQYEVLLDDVVADLGRLIDSTGHNNPAASERENEIWETLSKAQALVLSATILFKQEMQDGQ
jgi:hypothetical protein